MPYRTALRLVVVMATASLALAGCAQPNGSAGSGGSGPLPSPTTPAVVGVNLVPAGYDGRFRAMATVLESPSHGPQLCHAVATSLPPQCGGPDVIGWDWDAVEHETVNETKWGDYLVTGTWDAAAGTFTLTEAAIAGDEAPDSERPRAHEPDFSSPCPEPAGGWRPVDAAKATYEAMEQAITAARAEPDFAAAWLDQSYLDGTEGSEGEANDPQRLVLNLRFTGDLDRHETQIRKIWGGALCVSPAARSLADLERIHAELTDLIDRLTSGINEVTGAVEVTVTVATEQAQAELDERYGPGVVVLNGWLRPIDY